MPETLAAILPKGAVAVERGAIEGGGSAAAASGAQELYPVEEALIAGASEGRRREFAEARACAREALRALGATGGPIAAAGDGAPCWPEGVVGSITHKGGYRAAVVAWAEELGGLGVDAEPNERLPDGLLETIASPAELDQIEALLERAGGIAWDRLLFSAKEAAVKAAQPLGLGLAGVRAVEVTLDAAGGSYAARIAAPAGAEPAPAVGGRWTSRSGMLLCVACVPRPQSGGH